MQETLKAAVVRVRGDARARGKPLTIDDVLETLDAFLGGPFPPGGPEPARAPVPVRAGRPRDPLSRKE